KSEIGDVQLCEQRNVLGKAVVKIAGMVAMVVVFDLPFFSGEMVPDGRAFSIFLMGALYLVGSNRNAPVKVVSEIVLMDVAGKTGRRNAVCQICIYSMIGLPCALLKLLRFSGWINQRLFFLWKALSPAI